MFKRWSIFGEISKRSFTGPEVTGGAFMQSSDYLLIRANGNPAGNAGLRLLRFPIGSLFKIVLAYAALKSHKLGIQEELICEDRRAQAGKGRLNVREAMLYSSNDFFRQVATRLLPGELADAMGELQFPTDVPSDSDIGLQRDELWHGAGFEASPLEVFDLTTRLAKMARTESDAAFVGTLERQKDDGGGVRVFGKTGTWGGAAWCTGFSVSPETGDVAEVITVLVRYTVPHWQPANERALEEFYRALGETGLPNR
jgi:beta-lactamase class D